MSKNIRLLFLALCITSFSYSQSPYEVTWKKEIPYIATGIGSIGLAAYTQTLTELFTTDELMTLDPNDINRFDRIAIDNYSNNADMASDVLWIGSHAAPFLFLGDKKTRAHFDQIIIMYGEVAAINLGLTVICKNITQRPRPYVLNPDVSEDLKLTKQAKASLVSGHASMTAANTFFVAKVFSDFFPDSKWKPVVWTSAAVIPAVTGYLRVAAGRHYPTDVIAGYALGATIGVLIPHFHRNKNLSKKGMTLQAGVNSLYFCWNFNR
jgi:membrane-associated phospholipid phosphatase